MAVELGGQAYIGLSAVPPLATGVSPKYGLRPATENDIPDLIQWDDWAARTVLLSVVRDEALWRHDLGAMRPNSMYAMDYHIITNALGVGVGYVAMRRATPYHMFEIYQWIVGPDTSYLETYGDVLRGLKAYIESAYPAQGRPTLIGFNAILHPTLRTLLDGTLSASVRNGVYAWYLRAASYAQLMWELASVLEVRLEASGAHRFTGELLIDKLDFTGLHLIFNDGRLVEAADVDMGGRGGDARFPWHAFLNLVFGHHDYRQLHQIMPDCSANGKAEALFDILFPRKRSALFPIS
jgi:hypothetical protein